MAKPMCDVAVVGCGLGGVATAIAIRSAGHQVTIYEKAPAMWEIGTGIQLPYNCTRILKGWNLIPAIEKISVQPSNVAFRSYKDGSILYKRTVTQGEAHDSPHLLTRRAGFLDILVKEALDLGVTIQFDSTITKIDFDKPSLELQGKGEVLFDVIFGADGQKSFTRETLLGHSDFLRPSGELVYRIVIPVSDVEQDPELGTLLEQLDMSCWLGPESHAVCYQIKELINIVLFGPDNSAEHPDGTNTEMAEVEALFESWDPQLRRLLKHAKGVMRRRISSSQEMDTWIHPNGTFALVGDACHLTTPHLAQGAAQAIEDAAVLGALLARLEDKSQIKDVLRLYESIRKPRTTKVIAGSDARRKVYQLRDGDAQQERDQQLRQKSPFEGYPKCIADPEFQSWLLDYDAEVEVEKAWQQYQKG